VIWIATHPPKPIHIDWPDDSSDDWRDSGIQDMPGYEDAFYPPDPDLEKRKCKDAEEKCFKLCEDFMGDPCGQANKFTGCMKDCMASYGCPYPGISNF
jgi:hypothetical protein